VFAIVDNGHHVDARSGRGNRGFVALHLFQCAPNGRPRHGFGVSRSPGIGHGCGHCSCQHAAAAVRPGAREAVEGRDRGARYGVFQWRVGARGAPHRSPRCATVIVIESCHFRLVLMGLVHGGGCGFCTNFDEDWWIVGKRAFIAGVADDQGFGWAIAKALAAAGAEILVGTWVPVRDSKLIGNLIVESQCIIGAVVVVLGFKGVD